MRYIIMHKTNAHWESGATPGPELIARVRALLGEYAQQGVLLGAEGLRASAQGARLTSHGRARDVVNGPFVGGHELPAGFTIVHARSLDEAVELAAREADALGCVEIDVRPVTEPWDIGMGEPPEGLETRRYMLLRKATKGTEDGNEPTGEQRSALARLIDETTRAGAHATSEVMKPSARGRRYLNSRDGVTFFDGPFAETKELVAGYIIVAVDSLDAAGSLAERYIAVVGADEVDVRELEDPG